MSRESDDLFSGLAANYDEHFDVPHRRAYDKLAWELTCGFLPGPPCAVIDVGCGVGRWAARLIDQGHSVVGIEPAAQMVAAARERLPTMTLVPTSAESAELPSRSADLVIAMGSFQYASDPGRVLENIMNWLRPGGHVCVLVDSQVALAVELTAAGMLQEAMERLKSGRGRWAVGDVSAELMLYDSTRLACALKAAGLEVVAVHGLLVGATIWGREGLTRRLTVDWQGQLQVERELAAQRRLADLGKQLMVVARRPTRTSGLR